MSSKSDIGTVISGRYEVVRLLGEGASGAVFQGRDRQERQRVAVKVLHADLLESDEVVARFFREMRAAERIQHPGVVRFRDSGLTEDGRPYLVQEFLHGQDMEQAMAAGSLSLPEIFEIALKLLDALGAVHAAGLVHRDVKPENVFLLHDEFGTTLVKLVDFGIVKSRQGSVAQLTGAGCTVGTPHYMSPEQAQGADVDARADLWSVGVVLFEALTGRLPFHAENPLVLLSLIVTHDAPSIATYRFDLPAGLLAVVDRALKRDRRDRWQSAEEMAKALRAGVGLR
jgi:serine/threonine-protein kinase